jgi:hypothetical protein
MAYGCLGMRLTLVMCLMLDIKLTLYQNFIYMVSYNRENNFQSYIIQHQQLLTPFGFTIGGTCCNVLRLCRVESNTGLLHAFP